MTATAIFSAIVAAIKAIPIINDWFNQLISAYLTMQTSATLSAISDAAALAARSQSDDDRFAASAAWQKALSRDRQIP